MISCKILVIILLILLLLCSCDSTIENFEPHVTSDQEKRKSGIKNSQDYLSECGHNTNCYDHNTKQHPGPPCVGRVPGIWNHCAGAQSDCDTTKAKKTLKHQSCDWCASMNHPHFDVDDDTAVHLNGGLIRNDILDLVVPFAVMQGDSSWGGGWSKKGSLWAGETCKAESDCRSGKCDWSSGSGICVEKYKHEMSQAEQKAMATKKKGDSCNGDNDCSGNLGCCWYKCSTGKTGVCDVQKGSIEEETQKLVEDIEKLNTDVGDVEKIKTDVRNVENDISNLSEEVTEDIAENISTNISYSKLGEKCDMYHHCKDGNFCTCRDCNDSCNCTCELPPKFNDTEKKIREDLGRKLASRSEKLYKENIVKKEKEVAVEKIIQEQEQKINNLSEKKESNQEYIKLEESNIKKIIDDIIEIQETNTKIKNREAKVLQNKDRQIKRIRRLPESIQKQEENVVIDKSQKEIDLLERKRREEERRRLILEQKLKMERQRIENKKNEQREILQSELEIQQMILNNLVKEEEIKKQNIVDEYNNLLAMERKRLSDLCIQKQYSLNRQVERNSLREEDLDSQNKEWGIKVRNNFNQKMNHYARLRDEKLKNLREYRNKKLSENIEKVRKLREDLGNL